MFPVKPSSKFEADYFTNLKCPVHINGECEILCCKKGELQVNVNDTQFTLRQNQTLFIMPFEYHEFSTPKNSECIRFIIYSQSAQSFFDTIENKKATKRIFTTDIKTLNYIESILEPNPDIVTTKAITYVLSRMILKNCQFAENSNGELSLFTKSLNYILNNFASGITLESTAKNLGVHPVHLSRTFSNNSKYKFTEYLNLMKFSNAQLLLKNTDKSITEISFESGFNSLRNFNRIFYSIAKMTPSEYRKSSSSINF